jgi:predicted Rossmann fold flavoprotein
VNKHYDSIIIGAGAAGLYCALHAGRRGKRVLVLEQNAEPGAKILISGGGRCNFTNVNAGDHNRYLSANPHFARSALMRHAPEEFIKLLQRHGIAYYEKTLGQLFCDGARSSQKIVRMLLNECATGGAEIRIGCSVRDVMPGEQFRVETSQGAFTSDTLVVATGGRSIPKLGATAFAYDLAARLGMAQIEQRPALVPLTFASADLSWMQALSGVSTQVIAAAGKARFREAALFTHRGLSGPAILQISSYWRAGEPIEIDFIPDAHEDVFAQRKRERPKAQLKTALGEMLPDRLASLLGERLPQGALGDFKDQALVDAARTLKQVRVVPNGTEGYAKAEVTAGGIDTSALSQQSMEARAAPGIFFIGECVDVTGWLGGYNFQWAWSSAWACAQAL